MALGLRKHDQVVVLKGRARGKRGKLLRFNPDSSRAYVEGANLVKRYVRKSRKNPQGGVVEQEAPIALPNLALFCAKCGKGVRFRVNVLGDGTKSRLCAECESVLGEA
jgi:large subunit ribosomal protein L24